MDLCLIFSAGDVDIPDYRDEVLFMHFKPTLLEIIDDAEIIHFGYAPDNTADGDDDLLEDGTFFRIICAAERVGLTPESARRDVLDGFRRLIENEDVRWGSVIVEKGFIREEITVEFIF